ncbi:MAG TPA: YtxH domain-containing protein [Edaphobacter sp.]
MMIFGMWLEDPGSLSSGNSRLLMFFVAMVAIAMVAQAAVVIGAAIGAAKTRKQLLAMAEELRAKALPVIDGAQSMVQELHPKFKVITDNLVETSHVVRAKAEDFDLTISEVNQRARAQTARVDDMVSSVLDTTAGIATGIQKTVQIPVREFQGLVNGLKAGIDVLTGKNKGRRNGAAPSGSAYYTGEDESEL